jgi:hypothetical protein
LANF